MDDDGAVNKDDLWLDAIDAEERGDRQETLRICKELVAVEPDNSDAWMTIARMELPAPSKGKQEMPSLLQAAKSVTALRKVVELAPENNQAWNLGGTLLVDHLGMMDDALEWWERRREYTSTEVTPLIEQISILVRMGYYEECADLIEEMFSTEMDSVDGGVKMRMGRVSQTVSKASKMEAEEIFRPNQPKHPRWDVIEKLKKKKPISQGLFLMLFVAPMAFFVGSTSMIFIGNSGWSIPIVFIILLVTVMAISRLSMNLLQSINRHALDLERAIDYETTTGQVCIPESIRESPLYSSLMKSKMPAIKERIRLIVESGERISKKWELNIP
ncbi:MAG TPA: hypothetical protein HA314_03300 [Candidatus Thalassarchaeaceae archaeon]|nr:MAG TPA: tetratricopeptide repeat protein [Candidatus Poseidoniales archaeon]HII29041.1 hypothetical protein [Candidatus Thalassarchaeaceae archaeon]|tara:strand:- start:697 stop:1686 length:990 start_codon:yes stop_codon:yes gene_type:complete